MWSFKGCRVDFGARVFHPVWYTLKWSLGARVFDLVWYTLKGCPR